MAILFASRTDPISSGIRGQFILLVLLGLFGLTHASPCAHAQEVASLSHKRKITWVVFSPDGKTLASASFDDFAILWSTSTWEKQVTLPHLSTVHSVAFSQDGKFVATGSTLPGDVPTLDNAKKPCAVVYLWDRTTGLKLASLRGEFLTNPTLTVAFSPDGKTLASGCVNRSSDQELGLIYLWDVNGKHRKQRLEADIGSVYSLAFSPDGKTLAAALFGTTIGEVWLWDLETSKGKLRLKNLAGAAIQVAFSPDGRLLATVAGGHSVLGELPIKTAEVKLWDTATGKEVQALQGHRDPVFAVAFSPDGKWLATGGGNPGDRRAELILWDRATGKPRVFLKGHQDLVRSVAFSPDSKFLASGSWDRHVKVWDLAKALENGAKRK